MDIGVVRIAEDKDFERLKEYLDNHAGWKLEFEKEDTQVWTKSVEQTSFKMIKVWTDFCSVLPSHMYDVLHDPEYRKVWDQNMIDSHDIGYLNPNNDVGYYANNDIMVQVTRPST